MSHRRARVLFVAGDAPGRCDLEQALHAEGLDARRAADGYEVVEVAGEDKPDVVVIDLDSRGGRELLASGREALDAPLLVVTATDDVPVAIAAVRDGAATDYLTKPLAEGALSCAIDRALAARALRLDNRGLHARIDDLLAERHRELREREDLLRTVAHDVRSQLAAVTMVAASMARSLDAPVDVNQRKLDLIQRVAKRMRRLVDELSDYGRLEAGDLPLELSVEDARAIVDDATALLRPLAAQRRVAVVTSVGDFTMCCARERIVQVLEILGTNAVRVTPASGLVRIRAEPLDGRGMFTVEDDGHRSPQERFQHAPEGGLDTLDAPVKGIDLGLAIAIGLVDAHGGSLEVESREGGGTRFEIVLPLDGPSSVARSVAGQERRAAMM